MREGQEGVLEDSCILVVGTTGSRVAAVVWTVVPQERRDARLQRQGEFIDQFRAGGRIWDYVVIIAKQPGGSNLERAVEGGREAALARLGAEGGNVQALGFTYLDSSIPAVQRAELLALPEEQRRGLLVATEQEVVEQVEAALSRTAGPVQVVFEDSECEDCGVVGDARLLPAHCHLEPLLQHPGPLQTFHPAPLEPHHPLSAEAAHPGVQRLAGGPSTDCRTARNSLAAVTPVLGYFDPSAGVASALATAGVAGAPP